MGHKIAKNTNFCPKKWCLWQFYGPIRIYTNISKKIFGRVVNDFFFAIRGQGSAPGIESLIDS